MVSFDFPEAPEVTRECWDKGCVNIKLVGKALGEAGCLVSSGRKNLSRGFSGPLFRIETSAGPVVEKTFIVGSRHPSDKPEIGLRIRPNFPVFNKKEPIRSYPEVLDKKTGEKTDIIDWVYNEEVALTELAGIPQYVSFVREGLKGSVLEKFIDGNELFFAVEDGSIKTAQEIRDIFKKLRATYSAAALHGYLYNNIKGSTILVDRKTHQPYLMDWYNHGACDMTKEPDHERYEHGLGEIDEYERQLIAEFDEKHPKIQKADH